MSPVQSTLDDAITFLGRQTFFFISHKARKIFGSGEEKRRFSTIEMGSVLFDT